MNDPHPSQIIDLDSADRYIEMFAEDGAVTFQTFNDSIDGDQSLAVHLHGNLSQYAEKLSQLNRDGAGVFVMVNAGDGKGRSTGNVTRVRAVFADDDTPRDSIRNDWPITPQLIVESSPGKFHYYWMLDPNAVTTDEFSGIQSSIAQQFDTDPSVKDLPRVMRLPGFNHLKGTPFQTRIVKVNKHPRYKREELLNAFPFEPRQIDHKSLKSPEAIPQGMRDDTLFRLACSLQSKGLAPKSIHAAVSAENMGKCNPPLPDTEIHSIVENVINRYESETSTVEHQHLTDLGNAQRLVVLHGQNLRFIPPFKKWIVWNDTRWYFDEDGEIQRRGKNTVRHIHLEAANEQNDEQRRDLSKWAYHSEHATRINNLIQLAKSEIGIPINPTSLDSDPWLLGVSNGVIDLRSGALREPRREDYITKQCGMTYDPDATCDRWLQFLNKVMDGNQHLIDFIQRAIGYSLTGSTQEQCLFFLYGTGANGKSVLLSVVQVMLGDYATQAGAETLMVKHSGGIPNDVARLRGARFVATSEVEEGQRIAEAMVKQMTGGDVLVARFLHAEFFEFQPNFKIFLAANHKPIIRGDDYAIWRRIRLIPFNVTIPEDERDNDLVQKLLTELSGIFNWALEGCLQWQREGLNPPDEVKAATEGYRTEMDVIREWMGERCVTGPDKKVGATQLYEDYQQWAETNAGWVMKQRKFGQKMTEHGFRRERTPRVEYRGIGLVADEYKGQEMF